MYPYDFVYRRARTIAEAEDLFNCFEEPAFLAGGHTLVPAMKNRLARPDALVDVRFIPDLHGISRSGGWLHVGAGSTHFQVSTSAEVISAIPALAGMAGTIADPQVRNLGTIGGSLANNDPAADYPSAVLGIGARIITSRRTIEADDYFQGLFSTALDPGEIVVRISFPIPEGAGYAKLCNKASRYAMAASFVSRVGSDVRVAITGSGKDGVFRWSEAEAALSKDFSADVLGAISPDEEGIASDIHGNATYRANLVIQMTRRAVRAIGGIDVR
ncbi:MAG: xanthine dehydrogenase family protein subunit M [Mesorhizobium sp.]|nr:MAG: xanthine dehydrogenase family protein subunit M [Mesorhizobium sp.]